MTNITKAEVLAAQQAWGEGIVAIASAHRDGGDFKARAEAHINTLYAYGLTDIMFNQRWRHKSNFAALSKGPCPTLLDLKAAKILVLPLKAGRLLAGTSRAFTPIAKAPPLWGITSSQPLMAACKK